MAHVHFFLNPKGGTGKSLVSYIVAQYLISKGVKTTCIDCDPVTPTLIADFGKGEAILLQEGKRLAECIFWKIGII